MSGALLRGRLELIRLRADGLLETFRKRTGLVLDAYFAGTKLRWILDNVPEARAAADTIEQEAPR